MGILVAGDVMLSRRVHEHLGQIACDVSRLKGRFPGSPLVANLESPICHAQVVSEHGFRADPARCADVLRHFSVMSLANNHALDCGIEGLRETVEVLRRNSVDIVGYRDSRGKQEGTVLSVDGFRLGFLGYVDQHLLEIRPPDCLATCSDYRLIAEELDSVRRRSDAVVCLLHAGDEMTNFPLSREKVLPRRLLETGFSVVVRSHSHVVQGCERFGSGVVFYGLGDFVFDGEVRRRRRGALVHIEKLGSEEISITSVTVHRQSSVCLIEDAEHRSLPRLPSSFERTRRTVDKSLYYCERIISLVATHRSQGVRYILWRVFKGKNGGRRGA